MKSIVAWGADKTFKIAMKRHRLNVSYLMDNNPARYGKKFMGIPVVTPRADKNIVVFVLYWQDIKKQLEDWGLSYKKDFWNFLDFPYYKGIEEEIIEDKDFHFLNKIIKKNWVCVDAGANSGVFSQKLTRLGKKVYAFEPQSLPFKQLIELKGIKAYNIALSDKNENLKLHIPKANGTLITGQAHILNRGRRTWFKELFANFK